MVEDHPILRSRKAHRLGPVRPRELLGFFLTGSNDNYGFIVISDVTPAAVVWIKVAIDPGPIGPG